MPIWDSGIDVSSLILSICSFYKGQDDLPQFSPCFFHLIHCNFYIVDVFRPTQSLLHKIIASLACSNKNSIRTLGFRSTLVASAIFLCKCQRHFQSNFSKNPSSETQKVLIFNIKQMVFHSWKNKKNYVPILVTDIISGLQFFPVRKYNH